MGTVCRYDRYRKRVRWVRCAGTIGTEDGTMGTGYWCRVRCGVRCAGTIGTEEGTMCTGYWCRVRCGVRCAGTIGTEEGRMGMLGIGAGYVAGTVCWGTVQVLCVGRSVRYRYGAIGKAQVLSVLCWHSGLCFIIIESINQSILFIN